MKLKQEYIEKYLNDFHYELTREQLEQDWVLDDNPYYKEKDCFCFHSPDRCWIEVGRTEISKAFEDSDYFIIQNLSKDFLESFAEDVDFKPSKTIE